MLSDEDKKVWEQLTLDVLPIKGAKRVTLVDNLSKRYPVPAVLPETEKSPFVIEEPLTRNVPGLDGKISKEIRRGKLPTQARIDLHGLSIHDAHNQINSFLEDCYYQDKRKVLVVTGKGGDHSIRREFPLWVQQSPLRQIVISCTAAHQRQGGGGAFIVVLRRASDRP